VRAVVMPVVFKQSDLKRYADRARGLKAKRFVHLYYDASGNVTSDGSS